jgi:hypothetical protein
VQVVILAGSWATNGDKVTFFVCPKIEHKEQAHDTTVQVVIYRPKFILIAA